MSTGVNPTPSTAPGVDKTFFCFQCDRIVTISISSAADPFCPLCSGRFLEELEEPILDNTLNSDEAVGGSAAEMQQKSSV